MSYFKYGKEKLDFPPKNLRDTVLDFPAIVIIVVINFIAGFIGLSLLAEDNMRDFVKLLLVLVLGWGPLFFLANRITGLRFRFFIAEGVEGLVFWVPVTMAIMVVMGILLKIADSTAFSATLVGSASGSVIVYLVLMSAVNEEFALANLQRILSGGVENSPIVVIVGIIARGVIFWGMHKPLAYTTAPTVVQLMLFMNGCILGLMFATTKRFSVVIIGHLIWNIIAIA